MEDWRCIKRDPITGASTWHWFEQSTHNPEIGTLHIQERMPAWFINATLDMNAEQRANFTGYKEVFTPTARIPEDIYWDLRAKSGDDGNLYDQKHFQKLLRQDYSLLRTDGGGRI